MYCWFCGRPVLVNRRVKNVTTDTKKIGANVLMADQQVWCSSCGAQYTIETYLDKRPTVSNEMLAKLDVRVRP